MFACIYVFKGLNLWGLISIWFITGLTFCLLMVQFNANRFLEFYVRRKNAANAGPVKDGTTTTKTTTTASTNTPVTGSSYLSAEILDVNPNLFSSTFCVYVVYNSIVE